MALPLQVKIEIFWRLYPNGSVIVQPPEEASDGIAATCLLYSDRADRTNSLIAEARAERTAVLPEDRENDIYNAVRDAALSEALSSALNDVFT